MAIGQMPSLPVTVLAGFLGAGKTTLLNHFLKTARGRRLGVIVNDFGRINIDVDLIETANERIIQLSGGCVCCRMDGNFASALMELRDRGIKLDHVLVEASGVALPGPIARAVPLIEGFHTAMVITIVDIETISARLTDRFMGDLVGSQCASAQVIIANKSDLIGDTLRKLIIDQLTQSFEKAMILSTTAGQVDASILDLDIAGLNITDTSAWSPPISADALFTSWIWSCTDPIHVERLGNALAETGHGLLRVKGFMQDIRLGPVLLQIVGRHVQIATLNSPLSGNGDQISYNRLICIAEKSVKDLGHWAELEKRFGLVRSL